MQAHAKQRGSFLQTIGGGGLEVVAQGNLLASIAGERDFRFPELAFAHALRGEPAHDDDFVVVNVVVEDFKMPLGLKDFIEPLDEGRALR